MRYHLNQIFDADTIRVVIASAAGLGTMLTDLDMIVKIVLGFLSCIYVSIKIFQALTKKDQP